MTPHSGNCNIREVAHNMLFPWMNIALELSNAPPLGTFPLRSLNDWLRIFKELNGPKYSGISPGKLFFGKIHLDDASYVDMEIGMLHFRKFPSKCNDCKRRQSPRLEGISPKNWLFEM